MTKGDNLEILHEMRESRDHITHTSTTSKSTHEFHMKKMNTKEHIKGIKIHTIWLKTNTEESFVTKINGKAASVFV
jgi:general stress protein 26